MLQMAGAHLLGSLLPSSLIIFRKFVRKIPQHVHAGPTNLFKDA